MIVVQSQLRPNEDVAVYETNTPAKENAHSQIQLRGICPAIIVQQYIL